MAPYPRTLLIPVIVGALGLWAFCLACLAFAAYCVRVIWSGDAAGALRRLTGGHSKKDSEWGTRILYFLFGAYALYIGAVGIRTMVQTTRELYFLAAAQ